MNDLNRDVARCPRCGAEAPDGECPACLLLAAAGSMTRSLVVDDAPTRVAGGPDDASAGPRLEPASPFGPYRIGRLLGRGGMGEVYEAEHLESGRRVALKILRSRIRHTEDRARFIREGQLAASISHPHTVYIFGSEEIEGQPVITMELLPGGTLKDRVTEHGPLAVHDAVSAVLDIIGGLDAAQAAGILHRDIKPSNCFTDTDGTVKVGDFGLSVSTLARDVRQEVMESGFQGTPQFAPPEQLRGDPLDVRADIYAVGATLYYLLTGRAPFEAQTLRGLVAQVLEAPVPSLRAQRRDVPPDLARLIEACLAKAPEERPASYALLAERLRPFTPPAEAPAPLPQRLLAGIVDLILLSLPITVWQAWSGAALAAVPAGGRTTSIDDSTWLVSIAYYGILEGVWGASLGKRLFSLRVTAGGRRPAPWAIARRLAVYHLPAMAFVVPTWIVGHGRALAYLQAHPAVAAGASLLTLSLMAALFVTARRNNGWAALHDLASGLRVVSRVGTPAARTRLQTTSPATPRVSESGRRCGPFDIVADIGATECGRMLAGVDAVLRRHVWIHAIPPGTPPITAARRDVSRPSRLHWLAGRRTPGEHWDAFEAPDGAAWSVAAPDSVPWKIVRTWLRDLVAELTVGQEDHTLPPLSISRLWLRADGHLVLLDHPAAGHSVGDSRTLDRVSLLSAVAAPAIAAAQSGDVLPLSARQMIERWRLPPAPPLAEIRKAVDAAAASPLSVARWRRGLPMALAALPIAILSLATLLSIPALRGFITPDRMEMVALLDALEGAPAEGSRLTQPEVRDAIEQYLMAVHREALSSSAVWTHPVMSGGLSRLQPVAADIVDRRAAMPTGSPAALQSAIAPELADAQRQYREVIIPGLANVGVIIAATLATLSLTVVMVISVVSAVSVPGGVVTRLLGLAVVTPAGRPISRGRSLTRTVVAWVPLLAWLAWLGPSPLNTLAATPAWTFAVLALLAIGAAVTLAQPGCGPHDRLTGCRVIPR